MILLDSNILIDILKGREQTIRTVESFSGNLFISAASAMELYYGAFNKAENKKIERFLFLFEIVQIDEEISKLAVTLVNKYAQSHTLDIPDVLIAATAIVHHYQLFTYNIKDFKYINDLRLLS